MEGLKITLIAIAGVLAVSSANVIRLINSK
jgi:hypothetical protein